MTIKTYIDTPKWTYRTHSTDTNYVRTMLPKFQELFPEIEFVTQKSNLSASQENFESIRRALVRRISQSNKSRTWTKQIPIRDPGVTCSDLVYSNIDYPVNSPLPVVWQNTLIDPDMRRSRGDSQAEIDFEIDQKRELFRSASAVLVSTQSERIRLLDQYAFLDGKIHSVPFYFSGIRATEVEIAAKHRAADPVNILFVGNPARNKRLSMLLAALEMLPGKLRNRVVLTIISKFTDGSVPIRGSFKIRCLGGLPNFRVQEEMQRAHILVNPSIYETFGFVLIEALASGAVAVGPSWEAQQEILDGGRSGVLLPASLNPAILCNLLSPLIGDDFQRIALAEAGFQRYLERYDTSVVGPQLFNILRGVVV